MHYTEPLCSATIGLQLSFGISHKESILDQAGTAPRSSAVKPIRECRQVLVITTRRACSVATKYVRKQHISSAKGLLFLCPAQKLENASSCGCCICDVREVAVGHRDGSELLRASCACEAKDGQQARSGSAFGYISKGAIEKPSSMRARVAACNA
mmetsp:Transcript_9276/g.20310  ORF Transcript_9276/g.20310 Transcript_9276/m.20310 type:complete len:155 (-) Transcript_9276:1272-1736(-)